MYSSSVVFELHITAKLTCQYSAQDSFFLALAHKKLLGYKELDMGIKINRRNIIINLQQ
jgi:hypothetical protein